MAGLPAMQGYDARYNNSMITITRMITINRLIMMTSLVIGRDDETPRVKFGCLHGARCAF